MCCRSPVSPLLTVPGFGPGENGRGGSKEETVQMSVDDAVLEEPIFGQDETKERRMRARVNPRPKPNEMTQAEFEEHCLTHIPYCDSCPYCLAGRKPDTQHRSSNSEKPIPLLHGGYVFLKDSFLHDSLTFLAA